MDTGRDIGQLRRGVVEHCILALLVSEERYGFDLVRTLSEADLVAGEGTVYPLLTRLAKDGYVTSTWRESHSGPPRKYYALTTRGREALAAFHLEWGRFRDTVDQLLNTARSAP